MLGIASGSGKPTGDSWGQLSWQARRAQKRNKKTQQKYNKNTTKNNKKTTKHELKNQKNKSRKNKKTRKNMYAFRYLASFFR